MDLASALDSQLVSIILALVALVILGFLIANVVYYSRLRRQDNEGISASQANVMMYINIVLMILVFIFVVYYLWKAFTHKTYRQAVFGAVAEKYDQAGNAVANVLRPSEVRVSVNGNLVPAYHQGNGIYSQMKDGSGPQWRCGGTGCDPIGRGPAAPPMMVGGTSGGMAAVVPSGGLDLASIHA